MVIIYSYRSAVGVTLLSMFLILHLPAVREWRHALKAMAEAEA